MIIKGLFRRYERWNPVHPTYGAFWGMGIGVGCGVGWGPGFGPDVIGYVGAGCGIGFSVGFTIAGIGVGLPANYLFEVPYNAFTVTRSGALEIARSSGFLSSDMQKEVSLRLSSFKPKLLFEEGFNSFNAKSLRGLGSTTWSSLREFPKQIFKDDKGPRD